MSPPERRSRLLVDRKLQTRLLLAMTWPSVICLATTSGLVGAFALHVQRQDLGWLLPALVVALAAVIAATVFFLLVALKISHRILGPLHRIESSLRQRRLGDRGVRIRLRQGDHMQGLADEANLLFDWIDEQMPAEDAVSESRDREPADCTR